jgi:hypothetical protein
MQADIINFTRKLVFLAVKHLDKQASVASSSLLFSFDQMARIVHDPSLYRVLCLQVYSAGLGGSQFLAYLERS